MSEARESIQRAMILAAGLGTRLRPVTDHLPKPLLPVLGKPLLEIIIRNLQKAGVAEIALNSHHLPDQISAWVEDWTGNPNCKKPISVFHEPEILGTGGGLVNAHDFLAQDDAFILHNGDVLTDLDLAALVAEHRRHTALATLALTDWKPINTVLLAPDGAVNDLTGRLKAEPTAGSRLLTYTGVAVFSRELFRYLGPVGYSTLTDALLRAILEQPGGVRGWAPPQLYWNDLGTVSRYLDAHRNLLVERQMVFPWSPTPTGPIFTAEDCFVAADAQFFGYVSLGSDCHIESGVRLEDCVVFNHAVVPAGRSHHRAVIGTGWVATESEGGGWHELAASGLDALAILEPAGFDNDTRVQPMRGHGSDRSFWRLTAGSRTAVLMRTTPDDAEFSRYIAIGRFLYDQNLGGPEFLACDLDTRSVLLEDLGDESLYRFATRVLTDSSKTTLASLTATYRQALDLLVAIQVLGTANLGRCPEAGDWLFDYDSLRWETDYFRQRFLCEFAGLTISELEALDDEFHRLATTVLTQPVTLMHRDYQSQNIVLKQGKTRLIDFQGMRRGPLCYDLMSLLRDSYLDLGEGLRTELMEYYRQRLARERGPLVAAEQLVRMATVAGLQRNMQALGAFAFLSQVKGKHHFRQHIPLGLRHLADGLRALHDEEEPGRLVRLEEIVTGLVKKFPVTVKD